MDVTAKFQVGYRILKCLNNVYLSLFRHKLLTNIILFSINTRICFHDFTFITPQQSHFVIYIIFSLSSLSPYLCHSFLFPAAILTHRRLDRQSEVQVVISLTCSLSLSPSLILKHSPSLCLSIFFTPSLNLTFSLLFSISLLCFSLAHSVSVSLDLHFSSRVYKYCTPFKKFIVKQTIIWTYKAFVYRKKRNVCTLVFWID